MEQEERGDFPRGRSKDFADQEVSDDDLREVLRIEIPKKAEKICRYRANDQVGRTRNNQPSSNFITNTEEQIHRELEVDGFPDHLITNVLQEEAMRKVVDKAIRDNQDFIREQIAQWQQEGGENDFDF